MRAVQVSKPKGALEVIDGDVPLTITFKLHIDLFRGNESQTN